MVARFITTCLLFYCTLSTVQTGYCQKKGDYESKKKHILSIAGKIWKTVGVPYPKPEIIITKSKLDPRHLETVSCYKPDLNTIFIGTDIYDLCMKIGEEALASVLGHEIGHYFNNHKRFFSVNGYILTDAEQDFLKVNIDTSQFDSLKGHEIQADLFSAFHCYSAGYDITEAMPAVMTEIYRICSIPEITTNYLPLSERMKLAEIVRKKFVGLIPLSEAAFYLNLTGENAFAGSCFDYIIENEYNSWELYNNSGTAYALEGMKFINPNKKKFIYPFEFEANGVLYNIEKISSARYRSIGRITSDSALYRELMFLKALNKFNTAVIMNEKSFSPFINLACIYELQKNLKLARSYAIKAESNAFNEQTRNMSNVAKGIIFFGENDKKAAEVEFEAAKNSVIAGYNLKILKDEKSVDKQENTQEILDMSKNEKICGIDLVNFDMVLKDLQKSNYPSLDDLTIAKLDSSDFKAFRIGNKYGTLYIIEKAESCDIKTARGIKSGNAASLVLKKYGNPARIQSSSGAEYLIYEENKIIFKIIEGKVYNWIIYNIEVK